MKRMFCLLLVMLLLCGCSKKNDEIETPIHFYYTNAGIEYNSPTAVIAPEIRDAAGYKENWVGLLDLYLAGPLSDEFRSPFPAGAIAMSVFREDKVLNIELSNEFAELKGLDLTIACACLTKTAAEMTGYRSVKIYTSSTTLDGNATITMHVDDLLLLDENI